MIPRFTLDAWALLALFQKEEPAAARVKELLDEAQAGSVELFISVLNLGEVYYIVGRTKGQHEVVQLLEDIRWLALAIVPATDERVFAAARIKMRHPLSYADAFAAATAQELGATLVTGDPELVKLDGAIQIERLARHRR